MALATLNSMCLSPRCTLCPAPACLPSRPPACLPAVLPSKRRTGLGDDTAVVPAIQSGKDSEITMAAARTEFAETCFPCVEEVLAKTGVKPKDIAFVITNSSLFNPTPSLSATIMNHFRMSSRTKGYSLGGMGCR